MPLILKNAPDVVFREVGNLFIVSFPWPSYSEQATVAKAPSSGKKVPVRKFLKESSGKTEERIIALLTKHSELTTLQLGETLGIGDRAVRKQIAKLRRENKLIRIGGRKIGRWKVTK